MEIVWNFAQHTKNILPHYHRFGVMPKVLAALTESSRLSERIALMHIASQETETFRARAFISQALDSNHRHVVPYKSISVQEKVSLHYDRYGWRQVIVSSIDSPTITVEFERKLYLTHESRVRPYFGEMSIPPALERISSHTIIQPQHAG